LSECLEVQFLHERVDRPCQVVFGDVVLQALGQQPLGGGPPRNSTSSAYEFSFHFALAAVIGGDKVCRALRMDK
jgi:hypothetical protein